MNPKSNTSFPFRCLLILAFLLLMSSKGFSQYKWWTDKHNWDGITRWHKYLTLSPRFMGPNALPVPEIKNGKLAQESVLTLGGENHVGYGDHTQNLISELYTPLFSNRVGVNLSFVPLEHYQMTTSTRDERKARDFDGKGVSVGDLYIGTYIQLVKDKEGFPDLVLTINLKTASGGNLEAARFTNAPGYFFDLSGGKTIPLNRSKLQSVRPFAMAGFYVWQTYLDNYYQDDSFLYGIGFDAVYQKVDITNALGGYVGYLNNGDRPMVYRLEFNSKYTTKVNYFVRFQQGFFDFQYTSVRVGAKIRMEKLTKLLLEP